MVTKKKVKRWLLQFQGGCSGRVGMVLGVDRQTNISREEKQPARELFQRQDHGLSFLIQGLAHNSCSI